MGQSKADRLKAARRRGGLAGGPARARALSPERRREIAVIANRARAVNQQRRMDAEEFRE